MALPNYSVLFDDNNLSVVDGFKIYNHNFNDLPKRDIKAFKLAGASKSVFTSSYYTTKDIAVYGVACGADRAGTEEALNNLKALVQRQNRILEVEQSGVEVNYTATLNEFNVVWKGIRAYVEMQFIASDPIGQEKDTTVLINETITTSSSSINITVGGSYDIEPEITITITAVTGGASQSVTVGDGNTGQALTITRTWTAGDVAVINVAEKTVTINNASSDWTGGFPTFGPGSQIATYSDTFTTRTVELDAIYNKKLT